MDLFDVARVNRASCLHPGMVSQVDCCREIQVFQQRGLAEAGYLDKSCIGVDSNHRLHLRGFERANLPERSALAPFGTILGGHDPFKVRLLFLQGVSRDHDVFIRTSAMLPWGED